MSAAGFTITTCHGSSASRLKSQLSFTGGGGQDCLSQISEVVEGSSCDHRTFGIQPNPNWDNSNSIVFSSPPTKRSKNIIDGDILNAFESHQVTTQLNSTQLAFYSILTISFLQFSLPQTTLEMATVEKLLHIPQDSVPCKIRAKRGCATHPRSIAERVSKSSSWNTNDLSTNSNPFSSSFFI